MSAVLRYFNVLIAISVSYYNKKLKINWMENLSNLSTDCKIVLDL